MYLVEVSLGGMGNDGHLTEICTKDLKATMVWNKCILALLVDTFDRGLGYLLFIARPWMSCEFF